MMRNSPRFFGLVMRAALTLVGVSASDASADENDPSTRIARLAYLEGSVSFQPGGSESIGAPPLNRPLTTEINSGPIETAARNWSWMDPRCGCQPIPLCRCLNISDTVTQIQLSSGSLLLSVRRPR